MSFFTKDQAAAFIAAQTAMMNCRVASMVAGNQHRLATAGDIAYSDEHFAAVEREFEPVLGFNAITQLYLDCAKS